MSTHHISTGGVGALQIALNVTKRAIGTDLEPKHLFFQATKGGSNIAWLIGHLTSSADQMLGLVIAGKPIMPESFHTAFGRNSRAKSDGEGYPAFTELMDSFNKVHEQRLAELAQITDEAMTAPFPPDTEMSKFFGTPEKLLQLTPFHIGYHSGQISLLRKMQGLPSALGNS